MTSPVVVQYEAILDVPKRRIAKVYYRQCSPRRPVEPVLGVTPVHAGRYHRVGGPNVWYASDQERAAFAELFRHTGGSGVSPVQTRRKVGRARVADLLVLDLTDSRVRKILGVTVEMLVSDDHEVCQDLALSAIVAGFDGILAPSAALPGRRTLVVFERGFDKVEIESEKVVHPPRRLRDVLHRVPLVGTDHSTAARLVEQWIEELER